MKSFYFVNILILCLMSLGCQRYAQTDRQLDEAENLMIAAPDSSLLILNRIQSGQLSDKEQKARHALLKSMALDKNYIDTTNFDVLQPALDHYPIHGTADEKLRTYPAFIAYLENHGLDENEINYLCLYAIGLKGKEVGNYMELRQHYNISSDIRKKLGIG